MMTFRLLRVILAGFIVLLAGTSSADAGLMLSVTDAGGGNTRWVLSGSTTALHGGSYNSFWGRGWTPGNPTQTSSYGNPLLSGSGSLSTTSGGTKAVNDVWTQTAYSTQIGARVSGGISWDAGDTLSWSGDFIVGVNINTFNVGTFRTNQLYGGLVSDDLIVKIGSSFSAVPEPTSFVMWGLAGGVGFVFVRRRRRTSPG